MSTTAILIFFVKSEGSGINESTDTKEKIAMIIIPEMFCRKLSSRYPEIEFKRKKRHKETLACTVILTSPRGIKKSTYPITSMEKENITNKASNGTDRADEVW